jgi:hypothetical protein
MFTHVTNPHTRKDFFNHFATIAGGLLIAIVIGNVAAHAEPFDKPLHTNGAGQGDACMVCRRSSLRASMRLPLFSSPSGRSRTERGLSGLCQLEDPAVLAKERCPNSS